MLGIGMIPHRSGAVAAHDINQFFEQVSLRRESLACRNFANIGIVGLARSCETNPSRQSSGARPRFERNLSNVFDKESFDERNPLALDPAPVRTFALTDRSCGNLRLFHSGLLQRAALRAPEVQIATRTCVSLFLHSAMNVR